MEELRLYSNSQEQTRVRVCFACMCIKCGHGALTYSLLYVCCVSHCESCHTCVCPFERVRVHPIYEWAMCAHGVRMGVNMLTSLYKFRTQSHPILNYLPKARLPY